jgi:hypothetical protein
MERRSFQRLKNAYLPYCYQGSPEVNLGQAFYCMLLWGTVKERENAERTLRKWGLEIIFLLLGDSLDKKMPGKN